MTSFEIRVSRLRRINETLLEVVPAEDLEISLLISDMDLDIDLTERYATYEDADHIRFAITQSWMPRSDTYETQKPHCFMNYILDIWEVEGDCRVLQPPSNSVQSNSADSIWYKKERAESRLGIFLDRRKNPVSGIWYVKNPVTGEYLQEDYTFARATNDDGRTKTHDELKAEAIEICSKNGHNMGEFREHNENAPNTTYYIADCNACDYYVTVNPHYDTEKIRGAAIDHRCSVR